MINTTELLKNINDYFYIRNYVNPLEFAEHILTLEYDISSSRDCIDLNWTPYLKEPVFLLDYRGYKRELVLCLPEQMGKSLTASVRIGL